jgi:hypothetical protein
MDMEETRELIVVEEPELRLGTMRADSPVGLIRQASTIATELARIIDSRKLYSDIRGKKYVKVEGWTTLGAMLGVLPREDSVLALEDGGYEAAVSLIRVNDGMVIGHGSALCGMDESTWAGRPMYARRSMAITRATGKAFRLGFSWIMTLAGYEATPAEEMDGIEPRTQPKRSRPKARASNGNGQATAPKPEPVPPDQWDSLPVPAEFTDLWGQERYLELGYDSKQHALNTIALVYPDQKLGTGENQIDAPTAWAALVEHAKSKVEDGDG